MNKPWKPSEEQRETVRLMTGTGQTQGDICIELGCTLDTLKQHFMDDLLHGGVRFKTKMLRRLDSQSERGSVPATRQLMELNEKGGMMQRPEKASSAEQGHAGDVVVAMDGRVGKKAALRAAAANPDTATAMGALMARRGTEQPN